MKQTTLLIIILFQVSLGFSQVDGKGTIDAQRPTLTESYSIILPQMLQFENGLDYFNNSNSIGYGTFIRGSILHKIELRMFTDYERFNMVGAKFVVMEPEQTSTGIGASFVYGRDVINGANDYRLALTKSMEKVFFTYNFGYNQSIYNIVLIGVPFANKFNYFIEYMNDSFLNRIHTGITYLPSRDIQLDLNGGWMEADGLYGGIGISFRIR